MRCWLRCLGGDLFSCASLRGACFFRRQFLAFVLGESYGFAAFERGEVIINGHTDFFYRLSPNTLDGLKLFRRHVGESFYR